MNHIIFFSGGKSSFAAAHLVKQRFPKDNIVLYFTDTLWEDEDLYRFIYEASDKLKLPLLYHAMGTDPVELMIKEKVIYNSRIGNCSKILKMKVASNFLKNGIKPNIEKWHNEQYLKSNNFIENATLYFGIGFDEMHRQKAIKNNWQPFNVEMPLIDTVIDKDEVLMNYCIRQPRLYEYGFTHNNCKGRCIKAGQGHFLNLKKQMPDEFEKMMKIEHYLNLYISVWKYLVDRNNEEEMRYFDGYGKQLLDWYRKGCNGIPFVSMPPMYTDHTIIKKKSLKDVNKKPMQCDIFDIGGCGCFMDYE